MAKNDDYWEVRVWSRKRLAGDCDFPPELVLYGNDPPYRMHITIGDPDSGDAAQFEKVTSH